MKKVLFKLILAASAPVMLIACGNGTGDNQGDTTLGNNMGDSIGSKMENAAGSIKEDVRNLVGSNDDSSFVTKALASNNEELILIQTGLAKGTSGELKAHARMMLSDHTKLKKELQSYASQKGYPVPATDKGKSSDDIESLNKNTKGNDWDKAWADLMEKEHKDDIDAFEKGERNVKDSALHNMISQTIPVFRSHLTMAQGLQKSLP